MLHNLLHGIEIVLASASPRRLDILKMLGLNPLILVADIDEPIDETVPRKLVMKHSLHKACHIAETTNSNALIIGADTLVCINKTILGKPKSNNEAKHYLTLLSNHTHKVYTGITIIHNSNTYTDYEMSSVVFNKLTDKEINEYVESREPFDKAGAYGIQGYGSQFVRKINGCYFNVMGFPVNLFYRMLQHIMER